MRNRYFRMSSKFRKSDLKEVSTLRRRRQGTRARTKGTLLTSEANKRSPSTKINSINMFKALGWILLIANQESIAMTDLSPSSLNSSTRAGSTPLNHRPTENSTFNPSTKTTSFNSKLDFDVVVPSTPMQASSLNLTQLQQRAFSDKPLTTALDRPIPPSATLKANDKRLETINENVVMNATGKPIGNPIDKNATRTHPEDYTASGSLLRPSFLRNLLSSAKSAQSNANEEEEEVTQTIVVPMNTDAKQLEQLSVAKSNSPGDESSSETIVSRPMSNMDEKSASLALKMNSMQPKAEASLQLTSTQMNKLLNDGEGPEFYREREVSGDGITLSEARDPIREVEVDERPTPQMRTSASGPEGFEGPYPALENDEAAEFESMHQRHRLLKMPSEGGGGGGNGLGFNQRFGESIESDEIPPRHFDEPSSYKHAESSRISGEHSADNFHYRPSSPDEFSSALNGQPTLEQSPTSGVFSSGYSSPSSFGDHYNGHRIGSSASSSSDASEDFTSRFGQFGPHSNEDEPSEGSHFEREPPLHRAATGMSSQADRFRPLSPVVPTPDELGSSQFYSNSAQSAMATHLRSMDRPQRARLESIQETSGDDESDENEPTATEPISHNVRHNRRLHGESPSDESWPMEQPSEAQLRALQRQQWGSNDIAPSLVLNVPPPTSESSDTHSRRFLDASSGESRMQQVASSSNQPLQQPQSQQQSRPYMIEFARAGSAGYLPPRRIVNNNEQAQNQNRFLHKTSAIDESQEAEEEADEWTSSGHSSPGRKSHSTATNNYPGGNPAHVGKYIIE